MVPVAVRLPAVTVPTTDDEPLVIEPAVDRLTTVAAPAAVRPPAPICTIDDVTSRVVTEPATDT